MAPAYDQRDLPQVSSCPVKLLQRLHVPLCINYIFACVHGCLHEHNYIHKKDLGNSTNNYKNISSINADQKCVTYN